MEIKRVFLIVLDSVGIGSAPDAEAFGDGGAHTFYSAWNTGILKPDTLCSLGLGNIEGLSFLGSVKEPLASVARMKEASNGKDTTVGHWEIAGHISNAPLPTFPDGFPERVLQRIEQISGRKILCNRPYSGTKVIADYGGESQEKDALIVYTSADSVLQIAAHTSTVPLDELYRICEGVREYMVCAEYGVGRIIARPFTTAENGSFVRTSDRKDFSLKPPTRLLPQAVKEQGLDSIAIGKISDIFAGIGFTDVIRTHNNEEGMLAAQSYMKKDFNGLCFVNLVDFDMTYGHRRDSLGYANAINAFDKWLGDAIKLLLPSDLLIITADHGCDPCFMKTTDHTREYTPFIAYGPSILPENFGTRNSFADIGATVASLLGVELDGDGNAIDLRFGK